MKGVDRIADDTERNVKKVKGKSGHQKMKNEDTGRQTVIPMHAKELSKVREREILEQAGLN